MYISSNTVRIVSIICVSLICIVALIKGYDTALILITFYVIGVLTPISRVERERLNKIFKKFKNKKYHG